MILDPTLPILVIVILAAALVAIAIVALVRGRGPWWAWALRIVAVLLLAIIAVRPQIPGPQTGPTATGALEVYFAVDTTSSVAAEDYDGTQTRLSGIKTDIDAIASALDGAQFSLITFDSSATQRVPLTADGSALESAVSVMTQEVTQYSRGSSVDEAVPLLTSVLASSQRDRPGDRRVLFYLGDGEQTSSAAPGSFAALAPYLDGGGVLGYGTTQGGRMLDFDGFSADADQRAYIKDTTQNPPTDALSRIDEDELASIATDLRVPYAHRTQPGDVAALVRGMDVGTPQLEDRAPTAATELYWWFAIPLGGILIVELVSLVVAIVRLPRPTGGAR